MANPEHTSMLRQGAQAWNRWRVLQQHMIPDFREADLRGASLAGVNLNRANLQGADLREANLRAANLAGADLQEALLTRADLSGANLSEVNLHGSDLFGANLSDARLAEADLFEVHLHEADLSGADLHEANLAGADLHQANLSGADLTGADLRGAGLREADLKGAILTRADLTRADLRGIDISQGTVGWTMLGDVDLGTAKGLETVVHRGPSTIGIDAVYRSSCAIPEAFLRGAGVPEGLISYVCSLAEEPPQLLSHFISYASRDRDFAERLHSDLRAKGVPCWLAPEEAKVGDQTEPHIDDSIHLYDRVLLILSEHSVGGNWMDREVRSALAKEHSTGQQVLFPVRLDDALEEPHSGWAEDIRESHTVGDFRGWQDQDVYQSAFEQLLRDLGTVSG